MLDLSVSTNDTMADRARWDPGLDADIFCFSLGCLAIFHSLTRVSYHLFLVCFSLSRPSLQYCVICTYDSIVRKVARLLLDGFSYYKLLTLTLVQTEFTHRVSRTPFEPLGIPHRKVDSLAFSRRWWPSGGLEL